MSKEQENKTVVEMLHDVLTEKFPVADVKERDGGRGMKLDYIAIDKVIGRMNEVFPLGYSWEIKEVLFPSTQATEKDKGVIVIGRLVIKVPGGEEIIRDGVGADKIGFDLDKATKTAMAEAFKKACHTLGVGLYLWDEEERKEIHRERKAQDKKSRNFSAQHLATMKELRTKLKLDTDDKLNVQIKKWDSKLKTKADLNVGNIEKFIGFLKKQVK